MKILLRRDTLTNPNRTSTVSFIFYEPVERTAKVWSCTYELTIDNSSFVHGSSDGCDAIDSLRKAMDFLATEVRSGFAELYKRLDSGTLDDLYLSTNPLAIGAT